MNIKYSKKRENVLPSFKWTQTEEGSNNGEQNFYFSSKSRLDRFLHNRGEDKTCMATFVKTHNFAHSLSN